MKINVLATGLAPDYYAFSNETVTAYTDGIAEVYNLSSFPEGGTFEGVSPALGLKSRHIIRDVRRENGVLHVVLCQQVGAGTWRESGEFDSGQYNPDAINVKFLGDQDGRSWVKTRQGRTYMEELA